MIAGSRTITDREHVWSGLQRLFVRSAPSVIITGLASGPDTFGLWWAVHHGYRVEEYAAQWSQHGRRAGYMRNEVMAKASDVLIAFYDGVSRGTHHMIDLARAHRLEVRIVRS